MWEIIQKNIEDKVIVIYLGRSGAIIPVKECVVGSIDEKLYTINEVKQMKLFSKFRYRITLRHIKTMPSLSLITCLRTTRVRGTSVGHGDCTRLKKNDRGD